MSWWMNVIAVGVLAGAPVDLQALVKTVGQHAQVQEDALEHVAITSTATQQELNGSGKVKHNSKIVSTATPVDGTKKYEIVKAFEDDHDISEEESKRLRLAVKGADKPGEGRIDNPFLPSNQARYHFWWIGPDPKHPGWSQVGFMPSAKTGVNLVVGQASIDADGYLRHMSARPSQMPSHMESVDMTVDYDTPSPWGPLRTQMNVEGKGRIFYFFHRQVKGSVSFSYALPGEADAGTATPTPTAPDAGAAPDAGSH